MSAHGSGSDGGRLANVAAAILCGGESSRMGRDKAALALGGVPNASRLAALAGRLFADVMLVGGAPPPDAVGRRVADPDGPVCGLRGLVAALEAAEAPRVLVVATDMPLVTADLLLALVCWPETDVVLPRSGDGLHPLCAVYRRDTVLPAARRCLASERLALRALLDEVEVSTLGPDELSRIDPDGVALTNVNTPQDLSRAEALLAER